MRYLFAILLCALGAWTVYSTIQERKDSQPKSAEVLMAEDVASQQESTKGGGNGLPVAPGNEIQSLATPAMSDPLAETIHGILNDFLSDKSTAEQRGELEARLTKTMLEEKMGDETTLGNAARAAVDKMLRESEKARAAGANGATMTAFQAQSMISMSGKLAGSLRRAMQASRDGKVHDGPLLSVDFDFDVPKGYTKAPWEVVGGFHYIEGMDLPKSVMALNGKKVGLAGYMMALGEFEDIHIFAVVESQWSCCFGTPPDIHQVVEVTIPDAEDGIELVTVPILVLGTLEVGEIVEDGWVISVYRMKADSIDVLE